MGMANGERVGEMVKLKGGGGGGAMSLGFDNES